MGNKMIQSNADFFHIDNNSKCVITVLNSGDLCLDFFQYANNFFEAAEIIICYLLNEAAERKDIGKLDIWYFALLYLYRQSLELILKSVIFQNFTTDMTLRKNMIAYIRHDLRQSFEEIAKLKGISWKANENSSWLYKFLSDIARIDNGSDMFRYPFGNDLEVLFDKQTHISLPATHDNMKKAFQIIKGIYMTGCVAAQPIEGCEPRLIVEGGHYYQQSVVGYKYQGRAFYPYYSAYVETGEFLNEKIISEKNSNLFMPMCYLYRNAIELGLKRIIIEDSHFEQKKALNILKKKKHSILGLWNSVDSELKKTPHTSTDTHLFEDVRKRVEMLHKIDCGSDMFRYPCNKDLKVYFSSPIKFDVENVTLCFGELCDFLDSVHYTLGEIKEREAEVASYYGLC